MGISREDARLTRKSCKNTRMSLVKVPWVPGYPRTHWEYVGISREYAGQLQQSAVNGTEKQGILGN